MGAKPPEKDEEEDLVVWNTEDNFDISSKQKDLMIFLSVETTHKEISLKTFIDLCCSWEYPFLLQLQNLS
eukprot:UN26295